VAQAYLRRIGENRSLMSRRTSALPGETELLTFLEKGRKRGERKGKDDCIRKAKLNFKKRGGLLGNWKGGHE